MAQVSGGEALRAKMKEISDAIRSASEVRVGFLENATYPDGTPVATVAAINNFGAPSARIPPRPFFTNMIADKSPEWGDKFSKVLKGADYDAAKALDLMGVGIASQLREAIVATNDPPNSPVTNLLKQRFPKGDGITFADVLKARHDVAAGKVSPPGKPLSWSGHLLASVEYQVGKKVFGYSETANDGAGGFVHLRDVE